MQVSGLQLFTLALAVMGCVLGLINTWVNLDKNRVKIIVVPMGVIPIGAADPNLRFSIRVTNMSTFPVSVSGAGVLYRGTKVRGSIITPVFYDGEDRWPKRLESRESLTVYSQSPVSEEGYKIRCAYAETQCGVVTRGTSGALKKISREAT